MSFGIWVIKFFPLSLAVLLPISLIRWPIALNGRGVVTSGHNLPTWLDRAKRFGVPVAHRMLVVPVDEAGGCVRFSEWGAGTV